MTLSERVANLAGPDRAVDALVHLALHGDMPWIIGHKEGRFPQEPIYGTLADFADWPEDRLGELADYINAPAYTASLDTAMSVVDLDRFTVSLTIGAVNLVFLTEMHDDPLVEPPCFEATAATPILALLSAALMARGL